MNKIIDIEDIRSAADQLRSVAPITPLLEYPALNEKTGGRILIKFEGAQITGSFKFRGAYNRLSRLDDAEREAGVIAWSSGNHAQGVAAAAARVGTPATIVMPSDAPTIKIANTKALGANIRFYDRQTESREDIARAMVAETGAVLVPSYDDPYIIAGQGTVGLEIAAQCKLVDAEPDVAIVCCGGGGLIAGTATALAALSPQTTIYSAEPAAFDDHARSLVSGKREAVLPGSRSICDALLAPEPGEMTFEINRKLLTGGLSASDDEVRSAMRYAFSELKLVTEPGGAIALATVLAGRIDVAGKTIVIVISGANVDNAMFAEIITLQ
jgi:threonine dehydratase